MSRSKMERFSCEVIRDTDKAVCIRAYGIVAWIPLSQVYRLNVDANGKAEISIEYRTFKEKFGE